MRTNDILAAVEAAILDKFPGERVYRGALPQEPERPCFSLQCRRAEMIDVGVGLVRTQMTLLIACYAEEGDSGVSREALNDRQDAVMDIFGRGFLTVGTRAVSARTDKVVQTAEFSKVTAVLAWLDGRPDYQDAGDMEIPCMQKIEWKITTGKEG